MRIRELTRFSRGLAWWDFELGTAVGESFVFRFEGEERFLGRGEEGGACGESGVFGERVDGARVGREVRRARYWDAVWIFVWEDGCR